MAASESSRDPFDLDRFVAAQAREWDHVREELSDGRKRSHWIWYIFPQMKGLGFSSMAQHYGLGSLAEARAYLAHPVLGPRLEEATRLVLAHKGRHSLDGMLGSPDDLKFRSCMTLFARAAGPGSVYGLALDAFCHGEEDGRTLALLGGG